MKLHPKIQQLKQKAAPVTVSGSYVDADGTLHITDFRISIVDEKERKIKGYLSVFGVRDNCGEVTVPGCFEKSIKERGPKSTAKAKIVFLWMHDMAEPLGQFTELKEDDYGLYFEAILDPIPQADRALIQIKSGTLNQFSIGYQYVWDKMRYDDVNDSIVLLEVILYEGSVVTFGCNEETYAIKSKEDFAKKKEELDYLTEDLLKDLPRTKQYEFRQLISKHISLAKAQPVEQTTDPLEDEPVEGLLNVGDYKINVNEF